MHTIDIHTHLLNPQVSFKRLFDRLVVPCFVGRMGMDRTALRKSPYRAYVEGMAQAVRGSRYIERTCLFGVDARFDRRGRQTDRDPTVCALTEDVLRVAQQYPDCFIPFLSVNPRRPGALELIDRYAEQGCRGAKCLQNYWGLDLNEPEFIAYFERLKFHDLPLILHIGSEYSIASERRCEGVEMLQLPLACGVKVIAAHMGLGRLLHKALPWRNFSRNPADFDPDYHRLLELLRSHPNLYADISAILVPMRARALPHLAAQREVHAKLLFGSDYPVPFTIGLNSYDLPRGTRRRIGAIDNPFDRYVSAILEYFPADHPIYRNYLKVLPNLQR